MTTSTQRQDSYQLSAFYFKVEIQDSGISDTSFKEVSGLNVEINIEEVEEGGENSFVHKLPKKTTQPNLVLKRGIAGDESGLVSWCKSTFENGFTEPIKPKDILVSLMNDSQTPVRSWSVKKAYPTKWEIDSFESQKNEVAIESIEFAYHGITRVK
jgi:phage tail-like protein